MSNGKDVSLGSLIKPAKVVKAGTASYPILSMTMHNGLVDQNQKFKKTIASKDLSGYKVVKHGQLVVSFPIDEGVLDFQQLYDEAIVSPAYGIWDLVDNKQVDINYLRLALRSERSIAYYKAKLQGSTARRRSLPKDIFLALPIYLPDKEEQERIVEEERLKKLIQQKRERQQELFKELEKSVFARLFVKKSYTSKPLSYLADIWDCPHSTPKWTDSGKLCLRTTNLGYGDWIWADKRYIDNEQFKQRSRGGGAKPGDIIISREGTVGVAAIVPSGLEVAMGQRLVQIRCKDSNIIPEFLLGYLLYSLAPEKISAKMVGSTAKHLNVKDLKNLPTPIPLLEDQILYKNLRELISHTKI